MKGITISSLKGKLTVKNTIVELPALPLGLHLPVSLPFGLMNIGSAPLKFSLDTAKFIREYPLLAAEDVVRFRNADNSVQAWKKVHFVVLYRPTNKHPVTFNLDVLVSDYFRKIQTIELRFSGQTDFDFTQEKFNKYFKVDDDLIQNEISPKDFEQGCYFSDDFLDFRNAKIHSCNERVVFLYNPGESEYLCFNFENFQLTEFA